MFLPWKCSSWIIVVLVRNPILMGGAEVKEEEEEKSDIYSNTMTEAMGVVLAYRHELGMNYNFIHSDLIVGSCLQVILQHESELHGRQLKAAQLIYGQHKWLNPLLKLSNHSWIKDSGAMPDSDAGNDNDGLKLIQRDLWTQYICQSVDGKIVRGQPSSWPDSYFGKNWVFKIGVAISHQAFTVRLITGDFCSF